VPPKPMQKRILDLSTKVIATNDVEEFRNLAAELRKAIRQHVEHLRSLVGEARHHRTPRHFGCSVYSSCPSPVLDLDLPYFAPQSWRSKEQA
jgi:hypothetical protein